MNEHLFRTSPHYANLRAHGVGITSLDPISLYQHRWAVTVPQPPGLDRYKVERLVQAWLEREFEASEFHWYVSRKSPNGKRFCSFKSFAL